MVSTGGLGTLMKN